MEDTELGRKIYVRPKAKKTEKKVDKRKSGHQTPEGRARQRAAVKAYWAKWRKEHGREPLTTYTSAKASKELADHIVEAHEKETLDPELKQYADTIIGIEKESILSAETHNLFQSIGMKFGYALGKSFGNAMIEGIKRAQDLRRGAAEGPPSPK